MLATESGSGCDGHRLLERRDRCLAVADESRERAEPVGGAGVDLRWGVALDGARLPAQPESLQEMAMDVPISEQCAGEASGCLGVAGLTRPVGGGDEVGVVTSERGQCCMSSCAPQVSPRKFRPLCKVLGVESSELPLLGRIDHFGDDGANGFCNVKVRAVEFGSADERRSDEIAERLLELVQRSTRCRDGVGGVDPERPTKR